ncbi:hypothetical protein [Teredinibacter turnerae]|uniref:hypothetical protein n=1 Tax=Teredinibacter turnerae TaxID=2426 RepID=UPI0005A0A936|nr:hypothetical protein [Teredinibacter turnerae]
MIFKHSFMKLFAALYVFYIVIGLGRFSYILFITNNSKFSIISENLDVWLSLAWKPFGIGVVLSALAAGIVQWVYKCKFYDGKVVCRNTWGVAKTINLEDILSISRFRIPVIGFIKLKVNGSNSSCWLADSAFEHLNTTMAGLTRPSI